MSKPSSMKMNQSSHESKTMLLAFCPSMNCSTFQSRLHGTLYTKAVTTNSGLPSLSVTSGK